MNKPDFIQSTALRYFLEVVQRGSITNAAKHLHVTASAVSRQILALEELLEAPLFDRLPRGMRPNPTGDLLAAHARRASLDAAAVISAIDSAQGMHQGHIRIACTSGFAIDFLPATMAEFRLISPGITFALQVEKPATISQRLLNGDVDIGLTYSRTAQKDIYVNYAQEGSVVVVMRPDHKLAKRKSLTLKQMHGHEIALPGPDNTVRQLFDIACSNRQLAFEPVLQCNEFETLLNFVQYGGGLTIAGTTSVIHRQLREPLHYVRLNEPEASARSVQIQTLTGRVLSKPMQAFILSLKSRLQKE